MTPGRTGRSRVVHLAAAAAIAAVGSAVAGVSMPSAGAAPRSLHVTVAGPLHADATSVSCTLGTTGEAAVATGTLTGGLGTVDVTLGVDAAHGMVLNVDGVLQSTSVGTGAATWQVQAHLVKGYRPSDCQIVVSPSGSLRRFSVPSTSMYPTIRDGSTITVDAAASATAPPDQGAVVVFKRPPAEDCGGPAVPDLVKRVIGLPGQTVSARTGHVYITGKLLREPWLPRGKGAKDRTYTVMSNHVKVPKDQYFVLGDNRVDSCDSRDWGTVTRTLLVGEVVAITSPAPSASTTTAPGAKQD